MFFKKNSAESGFFSHSPLLAFALLLSLLLSLTGCGLASQLLSEYTHVQVQTQPQEITTQVSDDSLLTVHFIDVGQADAALLIQGDQSILIDGGNVADSDLIVAYLWDQGIEALDYMVCTHAHEDHVGGLTAALAKFPVGQVFSPVTQYDSKAFTDFAQYSQDQGLELTYPVPGTTLPLGQAQITLLGPVKDYSDANDTSIVLRVDFGQTSFLFTGDIERAAEEDIIASGAFLEADVLKVCHHGSNSSSTYPFIRAVSPTYGVISSGADNDYGHPHEDVLSRFRDAGTQLFRTDLQGHIVAHSDGSQVTFTTEKNSDTITNPTQDTPQPLIYIGNLNSQVFHLESCSGLPAQDNQVIFQSYEEATQEGYRPCGRCNP